MSKEEAGSAAMSSESIDFLDEVKKGKPRKFAMICKGTNVVSLVIFKKGNPEKRKKEAKEAGKGQFYHGVVDGKGQSIRFVLARADGFDSEPVKTTVLKGFLADEAGLKCAPYFEIVDAAPLVLDEDDPLVARFLKLQDAALRACDAHPDRAEEINTHCLRIGSFLDQDQPEKAEARLEELEALLAGLDGARPDAVPAAPPTPPAADDVRVAKLTEALKKLKPLLEQALQRVPQRKAELLQAVTRARDGIAHRQLDQAQTEVVALGRLLQSILAAPAPAAVPPEAPPAAEQDPTAQIMAALNKLAPLVKTLVASHPQRKDDLLRPIQTIQMNLRASDFTAAQSQLGALARLVKELSSAPSAAPAEAPSAASAEWAAAFAKQWAAARQAWQDASDAVDSQISQLQKALRESGDEELEEIAEFGLNGVTGGFKVPLLASLRDVDNAVGEQQAKAIAKARTVVADFLKHLSASEQVAACDDNPFGVSVTIRDSLGQSLAQLSSALEAGASAG